MALDILVEEGFTIDSSVFPIRHDRCGRLMAFLLLLLATALLFNRPGDWLPTLAGLPLFQIAVVSCLALCTGRCSSHLRSVSVAQTPITICVLGLLGVTIVSNLVNSTSSIDISIDFAKACAFYLLVVALVDSPAKVSAFVNAVAISIFFVGLLMILSHHTTLFGTVTLEGSVEEMRAEALGGANFDPNDTAALLVLSILIFLANAIDAHSLIMRGIWLTLAALMVHGMQLANSRGAFLALIAGTAMYTWTRWGTKGLRWGILLIPLGAALVATDRMTELDAIRHGTGQSRMQLWSMGMSLFFRNPLLGVGPGEYLNYTEKACHNTFVQAYAELGILGGALFAVAFYSAVILAFRITKVYFVDDEGSDAQAEPVVYVIPALIVAYITSILTLNHLYACHTYLLLALGTAAAAVYGRCTVEAPVFESGLFAKLATVSCAFIVLTYLACLVFVQW